jgi:hypothetical protein
LDPKAGLDGCGKSCPQKIDDKIDLRWNDGRFDVLRTWNVKVGDLEKGRGVSEMDSPVFDRKH